MFVYSLAGLTVDGEAAAEVELADSPITARLGVYQELSRLFAGADRDSFETAVAGKWPERLAHDASLLPYPFDYGQASVEEGVSEQDFQAEYLRLFEVGAGVGGPPAPLFGGVYGGGERMKKLEDVVRFYEYFGLHASAEDPRPPDHLSTEFEFMKFLAYKEAVSASPRLQASFRRAQLDFAERELRWLPTLVESVDANKPQPFWKWAVDTASSFVTTDVTYMRQASA